MKLKAEDIIIYPTDTVWGIGASIYSEQAVKEIAKIKGTALDKPLSVMFTDMNELYRSFSFPSKITPAWLSEYFKMESTLGIPLSDAKIEIPVWVTRQSDIVSVRLLEWDILKKITSDLSAPFFTTSLNLTGKPPITTFSEAAHFQKDHAPKAHFIGESTHNFSGQSSTIIFLRGNKFEVIRAGQQIEEIKKHLADSGFTN
jgi:L-threonylcarbamoyladenylate synthase